MSILRMGDRAVDCARLESVCAARHQGFESPPIRCLFRLVLFFMLGSAAHAENNLATATREYQRANFDAALAALDRAAQSSAPAPESFDLRGLIYMEQERFDDAKEAL